jgi:hypothetical protein
MSRCIPCASEVAESNRFCPACGAALAGGAFATQTAAMSTPRAASASNERRTSSVLGGRYRIVALLDKGGMGEAYAADDPSREQSVALKVPAAR